MALTLVTGPPNSAKAGLLLDSYRQALERAGTPESEPLLVVPTAADAAHYRRELADAGAVMGLRVERFDGLLAEIARRAAAGAEPLGPAARTRLLQRAVTSAPLEALTTSAATGGFVDALGDLIEELEVARVTTQRLAAALERWSAGDVAAAARGNDIVALTREYRRLRDATGRPDYESWATGALDALRASPASWGPTPVFFYGFDDLTALQWDAVETLARVVDAQVEFSMTFEPGRMSFAARAPVHARLDAIATRRVQMEPRDEYYAPQSRAALHHLERSLFAGAAERIGAGSAVQLLEGGGERAEMELVVAEVKRLLDGGMPAGEITVVVRSGDPAAALLEDLLEDAGMSFDLRTRTPFQSTAVGGGVLALLRAASPSGSARDLVRWLRTPGVLTKPSLADDLEARARSQGLKTAADARAAWDAFELDAVDRMTRAREAGGAALLDAVAAECKRLFAAPRRRGAAVIAGDEALEGAALTEALRTLDELSWLHRSGRAGSLDARALVDSLARVRVRTPARDEAATVSVVDPLGLRARRVRALFVCGCQDGVYPRSDPPDPFFSDADRAAIARASGLVLGRDEDRLGAERQLFHSLVTRPTDMLALSWRMTDDDGNALVRSPFVDDVTDLFDADLEQSRTIRALGSARWPAAGEPSPRARARSQALSGQRSPEPHIAPLRDPAVAAHLAARAEFSASALERWHRCPVSWFAQRLLQAKPLGDDPMAMIRGTLAHAVLQHTLAALSPDAVTEATLPRALDAMRAALTELAPQHRLSPSDGLCRVELRRLETDLDRYLRHAAALPDGFHPAHLELEFGMGSEDDARGGDGFAAAELSDGERNLRLRGRIDRVDTDGSGNAALIDYKGRTITEGAAKWLEEGSLQVALYMLAARELLNVNPVAGVYQPLGRNELRARGAVRSDVAQWLNPVATDVLDPAEFDDLLAGALDMALTAAEELRRGDLEPRERLCAYGGRCGFPVLCRLDRA